MKDLFWNSFLHDCLFAYLCLVFFLWDINVNREFYLFIHSKSSFIFLDFLLSLPECVMVI